VGYSLGGATALRLAIDHPEVVDRLVLVSTAFAFSNWHDYNQQGMKQVAADPAGTAEGLKQTPMYQQYIAIAPDGEAKWAPAVAEVASLVGNDFDWSAEVPNIKVPTLLVYADWDAVRISAATKFFEMLGGGAQDANWDRSGMGQNHFAVIPNASHYDIFMSSAVTDVAIPFLDGYPAASQF
jgi:pimeloyl-ACP methyl ester carboxylesterase